MLLLTSFECVLSRATRINLTDGAAIQVSVGIEHIKDIIADFDNALKAAVS